MPTNSLDHREISNDAGAGALQPLPPGVRPGAQIDVRGARWRLEQAIVRDDCCELHVAPATGGGRRVLLWPFDRPVAVDAAARFRVVRARHWWPAIAAALGHETGPGRARRSSGPTCCRTSSSRRSRWPGAPCAAPADEVGLGKTVQAGWIVADLVERERDARVLIAVPAGLRGQWQAELDRLFGLRAMSVDAAWLRATVADLPADISPWSAPASTSDRSTF